MRNAPIKIDFFTSTFAKLEPQDLTELLSDFWEWLKHKIEDAKTTDMDKKRGKLL